MTKIYKNIQLDIDQISTSIMVFERFIMLEVLQVLLKCADQG